METAEHYDFLISDNNDPVRDSDVLKQYMNKWDGKPFIDAMNLSEEKTVFEIGVGSGRIAVQVADYCKKLFAVDLSPKTIERAKENLMFADNVEFILADYLDYNFNIQFDIIYSSLTLMHIKDKQSFFCKVFDDLKIGGKFVLSIDDENQNEYIDMGIYKVKIYPDTPEKTQAGLLKSGFKIDKIIVTEFAHIFVCEKI